MRHATFKSALIGLGTCAIALALWPAQSPAQFGTIFGGDPPRPPSDVPGSRQQPPQQPPPTLRGSPPVQRDNVQSQPLPPPPGAPAVPLDNRPQQSQQQQSPTPGLAPGQRQPRGVPQSQQAATPPAPEEPVEAPTPKVPNNAAVFSGLDKITGRIISFDVALNETVQFGALQVTPRACYTRPPTELPLTDGFVEVSEVTLQGEVRRIFTGWMFASSPGLHGVEHSIYDVWLTDCKEPQQQQRVAEEPAPAPQRQTRPQAPAGGAAPRPNPNAAPGLRPAQPAQQRSAPTGTLTNPR